MPHRPGLTLLVGLCLAQQVEQPRILRPTDQAALEPGPVSVIAHGDKLRLDGKPVAVEQVAPGVLTAIIKPGPGAHELSVGGDTVRFFVGAAPPAGWKPYRPHPPAASCDACHALKDGAWAIKSATLAESCGACHDLKKFPVTHTHNTEILSECAMCHNPHGSAEKFHLKLAKDVACKQCHG